MTSPALLIGDIGGTNARFALAKPGRPGFGKVLSLSCADFTAADEAIAHYLEQVELSNPAVICLAVAGPVDRQAVQMTNCHWQLDAGALASRFKVPSVHLLNDFEAVALALPALGPGDRQAIGCAAPKTSPVGDFTMAVLGPGTGLGVAGLLSRDDVRQPVVGEGGHRGFAPETARQLRLLERLRDRFERVSVERILSGPGLENLYDALQPAGTGTGNRLAAAEIFSGAQAASDSIASEAVELFFEILGQLAGDLALEMGALDGVYVAGGIAPRYPELLERSGFRAAFERKGRYRGMLESVPTWLLTHPHPGLLGAASVAQRRYAAAR